MAEQTIRKAFNQFKGKDLRSSDLIRGIDYAIEYQNVVPAIKQAAIITREGAKIRAPNGQYVGMWTYSYSDSSTGETQQELISIGENLFRRVTKTFTITYSGSNNPVQFNLSLNTTTATFKVNIVEDIAGTLTTKLDYDLGIGLEASPITLSNLQTQVNAISGGLYVATMTATGGNPAAFLPITLNADLATSPKTVVMNYYQWEQINSTASNPFGTYFAQRGNANFELASAINMDQCLYIATGYEFVHKYDGQTAYREGGPEPAAPTLALAAGALTGSYFYFHTYQQKDNRGNTREFTRSDDSATVAPSTQSINVTYNNILAGTGFNTNCALVNGNQVGITTGVTVTNTPHTMKVGDRAMLLDRSVSPPAIVERILTAVTTTTLSWASATAINVNSGDPISNGLTSRLYRNKNGGVLPYLSFEMPNNSFAATTVFNDNRADSSMTELYVEPTKDPDLLPYKPKYLREHQGMKVAAGDPTKPNTFFHTDAANTEGYPELSNYIDAPSTVRGGISGIISDGDRLIIGKETSLYSYPGDLDAGGIIPVKIGEGDIGIACHNTIADTPVGNIFLSLNGFRIIKYGQIDPLFGAQVDPIFTDIYLSTSEQPQQKRCIATVSEKDKRYYCFVPRESGTGTGKYANTFSTVEWYSWEYAAWGNFTGWNAGGGICLFNNRVHFQSRRDDATLTVTGNQWEVSNTGTQHDFADHHEGIDFIFGSQWDESGEPSVFKKALWLKLYNLYRDNLGSAFTLSAKTERDYSIDVPHTQVTFDFGSISALGWGLFPWGIGSWGTPITQVRRSKLLAGKHKAIRFVFTNSNLHQRTALTGYEYVIVPAYKIEMKE